MHCLSFGFKKWGLPQPPQPEGSCPGDDPREIQCEGPAKGQSSGDPFPSEQVVQRVNEGGIWQGTRPRVDLRGVDDQWVQKVLQGHMDQQIGSDGDERSIAPDVSQATADIRPSPRRHPTEICSGPNHCRYCQDYGDLCHIGVDAHVVPEKNRQGRERARPEKPPAPPNPTAYLPERQTLESPNRPPAKGDSRKS